MFECYYDNKAKEFYELKMGQLTNYEYVTKFLKLLRYVPYIREEKSKTQRFMSGFPVEFRHKIELLEPQNLKEAIKKLGHCYEKVQHKPDTRGNWQDKESAG